MLLLNKYSEVLGLPVICIESAQKLGTVQDAIFSPLIKKAVAFSLEKRKCEFARKVIFLGNIKSIGKEAIIINDHKDIDSLSKTEYLRMFENMKLIGLKVYTTDGQDLGEVKDIIFDFKTGRIDGVEISDGLIRDLFEGRRILPLYGKVKFGEDSIVVGSESVEEVLTKNKGLNNILNTRGE